MHTPTIVTQVMQCCLPMMPTHECRLPRPQRTPPYSDQPGRQPPDRMQALGRLARDDVHRNAAQETSGAGIS